MKKYLCMMIVLVGLSATSRACVDTMLRRWDRMGYRGGGLMMWVLLIIVILTGCMPY